MVCVCVCVCVGGGGGGVDDVTKKSLDIFCKVLFFTIRAKMQ